MIHVLANSVPTKSDTCILQRNIACTKTYTCITIILEIRNGVKGHRMKFKLSPKHLDLHPPHGYFTFMTGCAFFNHFHTKKKRIIHPELNFKISR